ncbi:RdgB/HAM1 family non-canonical purine NTP pyrophosphatase [Lichenicoccus sp.]|uniref:RdgB/HAM1 family non-canonical purine NTP pyrophosphatase n=1 Tax=Lichenicoccus sp. TaxID=2781899 RepID=UPI003D0981F1
MSRRLERGDRLVLASHNAGKLAEFEQLLAGTGVELVSAARLGLPEPEETADSFAGNAALKAHAAAAASGLPALSDDSGFCVRALVGAPGLYSARWAGPGRDFSVAMQRVRDAVAASADPADTRAWFISVLCLAWPDAEARSFEGRIDGSFAWPPRGGNGHGYDPVFVPDGDTRRFAEMDDAEKNAISHRARSFALFAAGCLPER